MITITENLEIQLKSICYLLISEKLMTGLKQGDSLSSILFNLDLEKKEWIRVV